MSWGLRRTTLVALAILAAVAVARTLEPQSPDRGLRFDPSAHFSREQQNRLRAGQPVVSVPDAGHEETAIIAAVRTAITADRLAAWSRQSHRLYSGRFAPLTGTVSNPPRVEDFNALTLNNADLDGLRRCEPGDCRVKLSADEIREMRRAIDEGGRNWRTSALQAFRRMLTARASAFLAQGFRGVPAIHDHERPVQPGEAFLQVLAGPERNVVAPFRVEAYLRGVPAERRDVESRLFWWRNASGSRESISLTHVAIVRPSGASDLVVAETQIYATHYLDASVGYIVLAGEAPQRYLVYLRRAKVDVLRGIFGAIIRSVLERRTRNDAPKLIDDLRQKLESGDPPATSSSSK